MSPFINFSRLFLIIFLVSSLALGGCGSYMPWFGDEPEEEEDFLAFEDDIPEDERTSLEGEGDPFAEESSGVDNEGFGDESGFEDSGDDGFASVDQETDKNELKTDVENLQGQQEALISKVRELQEIISTMEPKITATHEQLQGNLNGASQQVEFLEPEVNHLKQQVALLQEELAILQSRKMPSGGKSYKKKHRIPSWFKKEYDKALSAYRSNKYDESILLFQNLAVKNPPMSYQDNIHYWIGSNFVKLEMYDDAIKHFETVLNRYPRGNKIHDSRYMMGVSYHRKGENSRAMDILQSALKFNPTAEVRSKIQREIQQIQ